MAIEWTVLVSLGCALAGVLLTALAQRHARSREATRAGRDDGALRADLDYLKRGVDEIRLEQREQAKTNIELLTRITRVESSASQAHKRLDAIEKGRMRDE